MSNLVTVILTTIVSALIGALVSLMALLAPIRKLGRRSTTARMAVISIFALLSFAVIFGPSTRMGAAAIYVFGSIQGYSEDFKNPPTPIVDVEIQTNQKAIVNELWMRQMIPPPLRRPCYTKQVTICRLTDDVISATPPENWNWEIYLKHMWIGLVSALTSGTLVWRFTHPRDADS